MASIIKPGAELVVGGGAFAAVLAFAAVRRLAAKRRTCATSCDTSGACCGPLQTSAEVYRSPIAAPDEPLACTADLREKAAIQAHMAEYRNAFTHLIANERFPGGVPLDVCGAARIVGAIADAGRARACLLPVLHLRGHEARGHVVWETRADHGAAPVLEGYFNLPERLREESRPGLDLEHMKREFNRAGLTFRSDAKAK